MALLSEVGGTANYEKYTVNGRDEPDYGRPAPMMLDVDDNVVQLHLLGSQHSAACLAAIAAMIDADVRGFTHLEIETRSNLLRNHRTGEWTKRDALLRHLHLAIDALVLRFEDVQFV